MNKMNWKWTLVCAAALVGATMLLNAQAFAGKTPPPPTPPPVHYRIHYFTPPSDGVAFSSVRDMNNYGVMVGEYGPQPYYWAHGWIYDPGINPNQAFDLNDLVEVPTGWFISGAKAVNDHGAILVTVLKLGHTDYTQPGYEARGLLIGDTTTNPIITGQKWAATWIPIVQPWNPDTTPETCAGKDINNNGDVLGYFRDGVGQFGAFLYNTGLYTVDGVPSTPEVLPYTTNSWTDSSFNNPRDGEPLEIAGNLGDAARTVFRCTPEYASLETFPALSNSTVYAINGYGEFCGRMGVSVKMGSSMPFRYNPDIQSSPTVIGNKTNQAGVIATDINDSSDVAIDRALYHYDTNGGVVLNVNDLVVGSDADVAYFRTTSFSARLLTERDAITSFPCIGMTNYGNYRGCLLIPEPVK